MCPTLDTELDTAIASAMATMPLSMLLLLHTTPLPQLCTTHLLLSITLPLPTTLLLLSTTPLLLLTTLL